MEILNNLSLDLNPEDLQELEKLQAVIERAIADGKLFPEEMEAIKTQIFADGKVTSQELALCRELITKKLNQSELIQEWD